jgi:hypothetical protein
MYSDRIRYAACAALLACLSASATPAAEASEVASAKSRLSPEQERQLDVLAAQHRDARARLSPQDRIMLDGLVTHTHAAIASGKWRGNLWERLRNELHAAGMNETDSGVLATYVLDGVAAGDGNSPLPGDTNSSLLTATQQMQETQMSFNMQYLELQNQMQNDNRQFAAVSNIMKSLRDTQKAILSNIK